MTAAPSLSPEHLIAQCQAAASAAQHALSLGDKSKMRTKLRFLAAAASLAAASIVTGGDPVGFGWTSGKQCSLANGCQTKATVAACLDCCSYYCAGVELECIDTCLPDEKDAIKSLCLAAKEIEGGQWTRENVAMLVGSQQSQRPRVQRVAKALAQESVIRQLLVQHAVPGRADAGQNDEITAQNVIPFILQV